MQNACCPSVKAFKKGDLAVFRDGSVLIYEHRIGGYGRPGKAVASKVWLTNLKNEEIILKKGEFNRSVLVRVRDEGEIVKVELMTACERLNYFRDAQILRAELSAIHTAGWAEEFA